MFETTGVSVFAYSSSIALISSFDISTALKTKSTVEATASTSFTSITSMFLTASGIGVVIFHLPPTASSYVLPALLALAAIVTTSNQGWFSRRDMNLWPTIPVPPKMPTLNFFSNCLITSPFNLFIYTINHIVIFYHLFVDFSTHKKDE